VIRTLTLELKKTLNMAADFEVSPIPGPGFLSTTRILDLGLAFFK